MVPLHSAPTVHFRLRFFVLRAILHHSRARRALVHHTGVGSLQFHGLREVSLTRGDKSLYTHDTTLYTLKSQSDR